MKIDISKHEIEIIDKALTAWEKEVAMSSVMTQLFTAAFTPEAHRHEWLLSYARKEGRETESEYLRRERAATMLRAKLYQKRACHRIR